MKKYTYTQSGILNATTAYPVYDDAGNSVAEVQRVYTNPLKRLFDGYFDHRYFVQYDVMRGGKRTFTIKKIFRRGKVWFEANDIVNNLPYAILYENWRIAIPELSINGVNFEMKLDKSMEDWSEFKERGEVVARWRASYNEAKDEFFTEVEIEPTCSIQEPDFFVAVGQAVLFIGQ